MRKMGLILSGELRKIFNFFKTTITSEDLKWLRANFPEAWTGFPEDAAWDEKNANCMFDINVRLTEILDAKKREVRRHFNTDGLSVEDTLEIAGILEIKIHPKTKKRKIINLILKEIRKKKKSKRD